ncbi:hypothetical protein [Roseibium sp. SCP14]|uniref:hypothetical protein n=1 Tax=Roseibium sp. SCP14 TaxID=3141375 RepID=UPI00333BFD6E
MIEADKRSPTITLAGEIKLKRNNGSIAEHSLKPKRINLKYLFDVRFGLPDEEEERWQVQAFHELSLATR